MLPISIGRTQATDAAYQRVVKTLLNHVGRMQATGDLPDKADQNLLLALAWLELQPWIAPATSRQYLAALRQHVLQHPGEFDDEVMQLIQPEPGPALFDREERLAEQRKNNLAAPRGAQQRAKHLSAGDWKRLMEALSQSSSDYGCTAGVWLAATRLTGLRPCEWQNARRVGSSLIVSNAKTTQGRSHGPTRTLHLASLAPLEIRLIDTILSELAGRSGEEYKAVYNRVRDLIADVSRRCLSARKEYPSLYTARHMFASAAKSSFTKVEVAALMGHANLTSAAQHYAAARYARGGRPLEVRASFEDISAVLKRQAACHSSCEPTVTPPQAP